MIYIIYFLTTRPHVRRPRRSTPRRRPWHCPPRSCWQSAATSEGRHGNSSKDGRRGERWKVIRRWQATRDERGRQQGSECIGGNAHHARELEAVDLDVAHPEHGALLLVVGAVGRRAIAHVHHCHTPPHTTTHRGSSTGMCM